MHHEIRTATERERSERTVKPSLNPYYLDDVALTLTDVMRARGIDRRPAAVK